MEKCPYCEQTFNKITTNHLKKHNIDYMQYLKEYKKEKFYEQLLCRFIQEHYNPSRWKFIEQIQSRDKKYNWITVHTTVKKSLENQSEEQNKQIEEKDADENINLKSKVRSFVFCDADIKAHLRQQRTIGIYTSREDSNCFITFDIDEDDSEVVEKIWITLNKFGIDDSQILASYSGNKGYHITVFFNDFIHKATILKFFEIILREANLDKFERENGAKVVEVRGATGQGVKIPFSINRKNATEYIQIKTYQDFEKREQVGKGSYCYLINRYCGEIHTIDKIESMQKVDAQLIKNIVNDYYQEIEFESHISKELKDDLEKVIEDINLNGIANKKEDIIDSIKKSLDRGIEAGNRHKTILRIAILNKSHGMTLAENRKFLIEFTKKEIHAFRTQMSDNIREIDSLLKTIYHSVNAFKYKIAATPSNVFFSKDDILEILSVESKTLRAMYFIIILHIKLYMIGNQEFLKDKNFYIGYKKLREALNVNEKDINKRLNELQQLKKIDFVRKGELYSKEELAELNRGRPPDMEKYKSYFKKPNIYHLNYDLKQVESGYKLLCNPNSNPDNVTFANFKMLCSKTLTKKEIEFYFKNKAKDEVMSYKYQKLQKIV